MSILQMQQLREKKNLSHYDLNDTGIVFLDRGEGCDIALQMSDGKGKWTDLVYFHGDGTFHDSSMCVEASIDQTIVAFSFCFTV